MDILSSIKLRCALKLRFSQSRTTIALGCLAAVRMTADTDACLLVGYYISSNGSYYCWSARCRWSLSPIMSAISSMNRWVHLGTRFLTQMHQPSSIFKPYLVYDRCLFLFANHSPHHHRPSKVRGSVLGDEVVLPSQAQHRQPTEAACGRGGRQLFFAEAPTLQGPWQRGKPWAMEWLMVEWLNG